jgi:NitT/TauT family transport system substrate-binding protein
METRRTFLHAAALTAAVAPTVLRGDHAAAEPPPETPRLVIADIRRGICTAPQYVAEQLLHTEGFTELTYLTKETQADRLRALATGEAQMVVTFVSSLIVRMNAGDPIVFLAGAHVGCFELFGGDRVRAIRDLKGKTVAITQEGSPEHLFLSVVLLHVGLDPNRDVRWVTSPPAQAIELLANGKIDALLHFPPVPQELRARKIGHLVLDSAGDRPWSQYFCCMVVANRTFVRQQPVAAKRALRALMKAADMCSVEPERIARHLVDKGYTARYEYALQGLKDIPYARWRDYDPADTVRYYALRLHEAGFIKVNPKKIVDEGTDWRFVNELRRELKG